MRFQIYYAYVTGWKFCWPKPSNWLYVEHAAGVCVCGYPFPSFTSDHCCVTCHPSLACHAQHKSKNKHHAEQAAQCVGQLWQKPSRAFGAETGWGPIQLWQMCRAAWKNARCQRTMFIYLFARQTNIHGVCSCACYAPCNHYYGKV